MAEVDYDQFANADLNTGSGYDPYSFNSLPQQGYLQPILSSQSPVKRVRVPTLYDDYQSQQY